MLDRDGPFLPFDPSQTRGKVASRGPSLSLFFSKKEAGMGLKIKIFGKENCGKCRSTKNKLEFFISKWNFADRVELLFYDMDTVDGMAEGAYHDVLDIPTTIFEWGGIHLARWDGEVPRSDDFRQHFEMVSPVRDTNLSTGGGKISNGVKSEA